VEFHYDRMFALGHVLRNQNVGLNLVTMDDFVGHFGDIESLVSWGVHGGRGWNVVCNF
jgi:hypothetical protein